MDSVDSKVKGVVSEVGLERDEEQFRSFNLKIGVVVKAEKSLSYDEGERMMRQFRKELLGKEVEITSIVIRCPVCGKGFNSEQGMKQHMRVAHKPKKTKKNPKKTKVAEKGKGKGKRTSSRANDDSGF